MALIVADKNRFMYPFIPSILLYLQHHMYLLFDLTSLSFFLSLHLVLLPSATHLFCIPPLSLIKIIMKVFSVDKQVEGVLMGVR